MILTGVFAFAQPKIKTDATFSAPNYSQQNLELSTYNITYDYKIVKNVKAPEKAKSGIALLQIGDKYNKFVDLNKIKTDSVTERFSHLSTVNSSHFNEMLAVSFKSIFRYQIIFNKENNELTFIDKVYSDNFLYKEKIPAFAWKLEKETKQILGYSVKKASVKYAGRNWTAWYAEDIPIQFGPYKFNGLPGLILEIYDDKEHYHFTANSINQNPKQIYLS
ncbi:GLPGLI family protein [Empedobacter tilapiae]